MSGGTGSETARNTTIPRKTHTPLSCGEGWGRGIKKPAELNRCGLL